MEIAPGGDPAVDSSTFTEFVSSKRQRLRATSTPSSEPPRLEGPAPGQDDGLVGQLDAHAGPVLPALELDELPKQASGGGQNGGSILFDSAYVAGQLREVFPRGGFGPLPTDATDLLQTLTNKIIIDVVKAVDDFISADIDDDTRRL